MEPNYRRCISCRKLAAKPEFWRVVRVAIDQSVQLDQGMGRSAYLCPQPDCLRVAERKDRLSRALKAPVPKTLYATLWERLSSPESEPEPGV